MEKHFIFLGVLLLLLLPKTAVLSLEEQTCQVTETFTPTGDILELHQRIHHLEEKLTAYSERLHRLEAVIQQLSSSPTGLQPSQHASTTEDSSQSVLPYEESSSRTLLRRQVTLFDHFKFLSVIKTDGELSAMISLKLHKTSCLLAGDSLGRVYLISPHGDIIMEKKTNEESLRVISLASYSLSSNRTSIIASYSNGEIRKYIMETKKKASQTNVEVFDFRFETMILKTGPDQALKEVQVARYQTLRSVLFLVLKSNEVQIRRLNGTLIKQVQAPSTILALKSERTYTFIGHEQGIIMLEEGKEYDMNCSLPARSSLRSMAFDCEEKNRAHGITNQSELVYFSLRKDPKRCFLKHQQIIKLPTDGTVILKSIKGYLVLATHMGIGVYNVTQSFSTGPREVLLNTFSFLGDPLRMQIERVQHPVISVEIGKGGILSMNLNGGAVATFQSSLPIHEPIVYDYGWVMRSIMGAMIIGVALWKFSTRRRRRREQMYASPDRQIDRMFEKQSEESSRIN